MFQLLSFQPYQKNYMFDYTVCENPHKIYALYLRLEKGRDKEISQVGCVGRARRTEEM